MPVSSMFWLKSKPLHFNNRWQQLYNMMIKIKACCLWFGCFWLGFVTWHNHLISPTQHSPLTIQITCYVTFYVTITLPDPNARAKLGVRNNRFIYRGRDWSGARGTGVERDRQARDRQADKWDRQAGLETGRQAGLETGKGPGVEERQS